MKKIFVVIILINICVSAQKKDYTKYLIGIKIESKSDFGQTAYSREQNESGFITGSFYWGRSGLFGVSANLNSSFFNSFSEYFWLNAKNRPLKLDEQEYLKLISKDNEFDTADKIVDFSFSPQKAGTDSVLLYCKYNLYKKKSVESPNRFNYEITFDECLVKIKLEKDEELKIWENEFPTLKMNIKCSRNEEKLVTSKRERLLSDVNEDTYDPAEVYNLSNFQFLAKLSELVKTNFSMGMEWIRTNKNGDQILMKRTYSPLKVLSQINTKGGEENFNTSFYSGLVTAPFRIYNPEKLSLLNESQKSREKKVFYSILGAPIKKENNKYTIQLVICQGVADSRMFSLKKIELGVDERIKIELPSVHWTWEENVDGERLLLNADTDYNKYVNDYIILSLESDK
ncbi:MAG: hypothetical protein NTX65_04485 [Ignavibacteriales bacterium]|nr:hypothetical protein [Ignavibacteriales bacterium]